MEIRQPHTRNVLRTGCAALDDYVPKSSSADDDDADDDASASA